MQGHDETVARAFTAQAQSFHRSTGANDAAILEAITRYAAPRTGEAWLEAACGPGIVSRRLAPLVESVHGVDLTPAMVELARRAAAADGIGNVTFTAGDATATALPAASFDGAVTRFSLHHLPVPGRLMDELARLVHAEGRVVVADHLADDDPDARSWAEELERLRDPSHWACLPAARLRTLGEPAGLRLEHERRVPLELDFDDWVRRGTEDPADHRLIERVLADRPAQADCFQVRGRDGMRVLSLQVWVGVYRPY